MVIFFGHLPKI